MVPPVSTQCGTRPDAAARPVLVTSRRRPPPRAAPGAHRQDGGGAHEDAFFVVFRPLVGFFAVLVRLARRLRTGPALPGGGRGGPCRLARGASSRRPMPVRSGGRSRRSSSRSVSSYMSSASSRRSSSSSSSCSSRRLRATGRSGELGVVKRASTPSGRLISIVAAAGAQRHLGDARAFRVRAGSRRCCSRVASQAASRSALGFPARRRPWRCRSWPGTGRAPRRAARATGSAGSSRGRCCPAGSARPGRAARPTGRGSGRRRP